MEINPAKWRDFLFSVAGNVEAELNKIGLKMINVNVTDIKDESGYIDALGKEAAAKAINEAKIRVADKLPELVKLQTDAIKNIKIDKVTVWDSGQNGDGKGSTAGFVSGLYKAVPPLKDIFDLAGMDLPTYLGKQKNDEDSISDISVVK